MPNKEASKIGKPRSLTANSLFNFVSQVLVLIIPLITTPYLARVLGVLENGKISFSTSIITYFTLFAAFGFTTYGQREIAKCRDDKYQRSKVFYEIFLVRVLFTIIALGVFYAVVLSNVFDEKYKLFLEIQGLMVLNCLLDTSFFYQGEEDFKSIAIRSIIIKIIGLVCVFSFVRTSSDSWIYVLCNCLATLLASFVMWPGVLKNTQFIKPKELDLWKHLYPSFLIFLPSLAVTIYSVFDKTMIGLIATNPDYENGCYEQAYKLNSVILLLVTFISPVMCARNTHDYATGNVEGMKSHLYFASSYVWLISVPLIIGMCTLAWNLSSWYLGDGYDEVPLLLCIMSVRFLCSGFSEIFGTQLFIAIGKEKYCTIVSIIAAVLDVGLNIIFIRLYGALGAAITTAIAEFVVTMVYVILVRKGNYLSLKKILLSGIKNIIAGCVMFVPVYFINKFMSYSIWSFLLIVVVGAITYALCLICLKDKFFLDIIKRGITMLKTKVFHKKTMVEEKGQKEEGQDNNDNQRAN